MTRADILPLVIMIGYSNSKQKVLKVLKLMAENTGIIFKVMGLSTH